MAELSERSGVPVPTIKYYLREGMLPPGEATSPNQASYDDAHVARLRMVRALIDVGGLSVASVVAVLAAVDDTRMPLTWAFGVAQHALPNPVTAIASAEGDETSAGQTAIARVMEERGWTVTAGNPGIALAARVLDSYDALGLEHLASVLPAYAEAAQLVAEADLAAIALREDRAERVESVVIGTVLGDALGAGLRRIAQEHVSARVFPWPNQSDESEAGHE